MNGILSGYVGSNYALKIADFNGADLASLFQGPIEDRPRVVNMSYSSRKCPPEDPPSECRWCSPEPEFTERANEYKAIFGAYRDHTLFVAGAGNDNGDATQNLPAGVEAENLITVGATNLNDQRTTFTNHGPRVDIAAPGEMVYAPVPFEGEYGNAAYASPLNPAYPFGGSGWFRGTSASAPLISGVAAMLMAIDPIQRSPKEIKEILMRTTVPVQPLPFQSVPQLGCPDTSEWGCRVDAERAVCAILGCQVQTETLIASIQFADPNLAQCVHETATAQGWQTVEQVTALSCAGRNITSLAGLESFINLQTLDLGDNQITDTAPLVNLTQLGQLDLTGNNGIRCMELDGLAATLASTTITRPADCISATGTGKLNDTGITWCADETINFLPCPVASHPGQDGDHGRDALARDGQLQKVGGGAAGFDFTKLDANGNALPASASVWDCVRDNHTGLIWEVKTTDGGLRDQYNTYTWYNPDPTTNGGNAGIQNGGNCTGSACDTHSFVQAVNQQGLCGTSDWRMPTRRELMSIVHSGRVRPAIDTDYFPNTPSILFWPSSPNAYSIGNAWHVSFDEGHVLFSYGPNQRNGVRLVRAGQ